MSETVNVNYGCGPSSTEGWINYDASPTLRLAKLPVVGMIAKKRAVFPDDVIYGDILKGLPMADNSADRVYCSHVLEHLSYNDCLAALRETYRVMKEGAIFRGVMPDLETEVRKYLEDDSSDAAHGFMKRSMLGIVQRPKSVPGRMMNGLVNSHHLWLWDYKSIEAALRETGFHSIRRAEFNDRPDEFFQKVENESRWTDAVGFECIK